MLVAARAGARPSCWPSCSSSRRRRSSGCAPSWPRRTTRPGTASSWPGSPAATATRPHADLTPVRRALPARRPAGPAVAARRSRRWRSSPTSSRSRAPRSPSIRGVDPDGVLRTLQARGYVDEVARDTGPGPGDPVRHDADVPREARPRLASPTCRRSPSSSPAPTWSRRSSTACGSPIADGPSPTCPTPPDWTVEPEPPLWEQWAEQERRSSRRASGCRRCWRHAGGAAGGSART